MAKIKRGKFWYCSLEMTETFGMRPLAAASGWMFMGGSGSLCYAFALMQHTGNPPCSPCLMYTAWHRGSLKLKGKSGTREGFEIFHINFLTS